MENSREWVIVRIDGKIAAISTDYRLLAEISSRLAVEKRRSSGSTSKKSRELFGEIRATAASLEEVWALRKCTEWKDLMLFGTDFQKRVWRTLWELTHQEEKTTEENTAEAQTPRLICYSDFAELCRNRAGVRAVAHAIGLNPVSVIIPCHLVIPKETIDRIRDIQRKAERTIFKGDDLCIDSILSDTAIDFGNYALGRPLKRQLIKKEFGV